MLPHFAFAPNCCKSTFGEQSWMSNFDKNESRVVKTFYEAPFQEAFFSCSVNAPRREDNILHIRFIEFDLFGYVGGRQRHFLPTRKDVVHSTVISGILWLLNVNAYGPITKPRRTSFKQMFWQKLRQITSSDGLHPSYVTPLS